MKPARFDYYAPRTREHLLELLQQYGDDARVLAGGQSLVPAMNFRLARPDVVIDINRIADLDYLKTKNGMLHVGALTRHARFERGGGEGWESVGPLGRWLGDVVRFIGHVPIRARGTFLGSLAHADPAAEWCTVVSALDAELVCLGQDRERTFRPAEFFQGIFTTGLKDDELLLEARLPLLDENWSTGFAEFSRRAGDFAIAMAAVLARRERGRIEKMRITLGGVDDRPLRRTKAENVMIGQEPTEELIEEAAALAIDELDPMSDIHATAEYRRDLARVMTRRALKQALGR
ncbi:MAG: FAD binding domain-containing protein [Geminicoccaceae bacterium]